MTAPHYQDDLVTLYRGDCLDVMREMPDASVDAVVTDPPYGLEFMGREWDSPKSLASHAEARTRGASEMGDESKRPFIAAGVNTYEAGPGFQAWCQLWATECLRILKPGGHLLAFGGSRTWHRLACAIEDAGFEMRDSIAWLYGSGFPKSLDVSKAIDRHLGFERVPLGMVKGAGNGSVVGLGESPSMASEYPASEPASEWQGWGTALKPAFEPVVVARKPLAGTVAANILKHGTGAINVDGCRVGTDDVLTGSGTSPLQYGGQNARPFHANAEPRGVTQNPAGRWPPNVILDDTQAAELDRQSGTLSSGSRAAGTYGLMGYMGADDAPMPEIRGDTGGASRFFPTFRYEAKAPTSERPRADGVSHPTVKPVDLMRWLVRLVTPPGGTVLDPFAGSGTTAEACVIEGFQCVLIEKGEEHLPLIVQRLSKPMQPALDLGGVV